MTLDTDRDAMRRQPRTPGMVVVSIQFRAFDIVSSVAGDQLFSPRGEAQIATPLAV